MNMRDKIAGILDEYSVHAEDGHSLDYLADVIIAALDIDALIVVALEAAALKLDAQRIDSYADEAMRKLICCNAQDCGCKGADVGSWLTYSIRALADDPEAMAAIKAKAGWV